MPLTETLLANRNAVDERKQKTGKLYIAIQMWLSHKFRYATRSVF